MTVSLVKNPDQRLGGAPPIDIMELTATTCRWPALGFTRGGIGYQAALDQHPYRLGLGVDLVGEPKLADLVHQLPRHRDNLSHVHVLFPWHEPLPLRRL